MFMLRVVWVYCIIKPIDSVKDDIVSSWNFDIIIHMINFGI